MSQVNTNGFPQNGLFAGHDENGFPMGDRDANADDLAEFLGSMFEGGVLMQNDPAAGYMKVSKVEHAMRVEIAPGTCLVCDRNNRARMRRLDEPFMLDIPQSDSDQMYKIIMRSDTRGDDDEMARRVYPTAITGDLQDTDFIKDIQLAALLVPANATSLNNATLTDTRSDPTLCGYAAPRGTPGVVVSDTQPVGQALGGLWLDTSGNDYISGGTGDGENVLVVSNMTVGDTPPSNTSQIWGDTRN